LLLVSMTLLARLYVRLPMMTQQDDQDGTGLPRSAFTAFLALPLVVTVFTFCQHQLRWVCSCLSIAAATAFLLWCLPGSEILDVILPLLALLFVFFHAKSTPISLQSNRRVTLCDDQTVHCAQHDFLALMSLVYHWTLNRGVPSLQQEIMDFLKWVKCMSAHILFYCLWHGCQSS
jgi:hypothetical protein